MAVCLQFSLVLPLWVKCCRPYLDMTSRGCVFSVQPGAAALGEMLSSLPRHDRHVAVCFQFSLVLPLWVKCCRPYLDMIDTWLYNGVLYDPFREFIVNM